MAGDLLCPACSTPHPSEERFCRRCGMPLVTAGEELPPESELRDRARKIDPRYREGELVKVAWAHNQAEAELIAGLLLEEGIPSVVRRARGFDVPDFLAAGPRDVMVASSAEDHARDLLGGRAGVGTPPPPSIRGVAVAMLMILGACAAVGLIAALLV